MELELLQVEPTRKCNLQCVHCSRDPLSPYGSEISLQKFQHICNQFTKIKTIKLQGLGEPLLHSRFTDLFSLALQYTPYVTTTTNGTISLIDLPPTESYISVSLNTITPETYNTVTGKPLLYTVLKNIEDAIASEMKIHINCVQSHMTTKNDCDEVVNWATDRNIPYTLTPQEVWDTTSKDAWADALLSYQIHGIKLPGRNRYQNCPWTIDHLYYDYFGRLHPCCIRMDDKYILNDITDLNIDACCSTCPL